MFFYKYLSVQTGNSRRQQIISLSCSFVTGVHKRIHMKVGYYMRILLCDDELSMVRQIKSYLTEYFTKNKLQNPEYITFNNGESLLDSGAAADIAFLDVEMPGISGIHVGEYLKQSNPNIIIFVVTAYPGYLDEAMHIRVFRYLSKPVDKNRLFRNMKDALF